MKYILKDGAYYFIGFDKFDWPQWMTNINEAKRYNTKEELESSALKISWLTDCEIIEVEE
jgi:hypothetical protein